MVIDLMNLKCKNYCDNSICLPITHINKNNLIFIEKFKKIIQTTLK